MVEFISKSGICIVFTYEKGVGITEEIVMPSGDTLSYGRASFKGVCDFLKENTTQAFTYADVYRALNNGASIHVDEV